MDIGQTVVIVICAILGVWYFLAAIYNRRRGLKTFDWLKTGLESLGKLSETKWIGSSGSGARLVVGSPSVPFKRVEVIYLLESREILPLWIFNHLRGKRDEIILKASLRSGPSQEIEAARENDAEFKKIVAADGKKSFDALPAPAGFEIAIRGKKEDNLPSRLSDFLKSYEDAVWRFSLQRKAPHLILRANLPDLTGKDAGKFFTEIGDVLAGQSPQ